MKNLRNSILAALVLCLFQATPLGAQVYDHSLGIRAGYSSGLTYKGFFLHSINAVEASFCYNNHGLNLAALYSWNPEAFNSQRWIFVFGAGVFGGQWDEAFSAGLMVQGGLEYIPRKLPLNFGLGWRPMLNIYRQFDYDLLDVGITIRYRFSI